jgi:hypothetical protein
LVELQAFHSRAQFQTFLLFSYRDTSRLIWIAYPENGYEGQFFEATRRGSYP